MSEDMTELSESNLAEQAYGEIRRMILERELPGGMSVIEGRLATHLQISRTPVREAVMRLAAEGLLLKQGSRSFAVRRVSAAEFFQSIHIREILECEAIRLAADRIAPAMIDDLLAEVIDLGRTPDQSAAHWQLDDRLHLMFARASGNGVLAKTIDDLRTLTRLCEVTYPLGRVPPSTTEHIAILEAMRARDIQGAISAMQIHLRNVATDCMDILRGC